MSRTLPWEWQGGVTDRLLFDGIIYNPSWYPNSSDRQFYTGHIKTSLSYKESDAPIFNFFEYDSFILPSGYDLTVSTIDVTGNDTYNLPFKAADIFAVGRLIKCDIVTAPTTSALTLASNPTSAIAGYDARFLINNAVLLTPGIFLCRITDPSDNTKYLRSFTVSGGTFTLTDIITGATSAITGLAANWTFELIGNYNIIAEGTTLPSAVVQGYIIKTIKLGTGEATIKFGSSYDIPVVKKEKLAIVYYAVDNARPQYGDPVSQLQHGVYYKNEKIDAPILSGQLDTLQQNSSKYYQSQKEITLKSRSPNKLKIGDKVYWKVSGIPEGYYEVSEAIVTILHQEGEVSGTTFDEVEYKFVNYNYDLDSILLQLRVKNDINKAKVALTVTKTFTGSISLFGGFTRDIMRYAAPTGLAASNETFTTFDLTWDLPTDPYITNWHVQVSTDNFVTSVSGYSHSNTITNSVTVNGLTGATAYQARIRQNSSRIGFSDWSAGIDVSTSETLFDSNLVARYLFTTDATDDSGNSNDGTLVGGATVSGGELVLPGSNDYLSLPTTLINNADHSVSSTFCMWIKFNDVTLNAYLLLTDGTSAMQFLNTNKVSTRDGVHTVNFTPTNGVWYFVAVQIHNWTNDHKVYYNGTFSSQDTRSYNGDITWLRIGEWTGGGNDFYGSIDAIRVYNKILTLSELATVEALGR